MKPAAAVWSLLVFATAAHFLVDAVAGTLNPLWPRLPRDFQLTAWETSAIFFLWQMTTSISQFVFGVYGDRFNTRWLIWAGPLAAIVCLGSIGLNDSPLFLAAMILISGLGIAAFHPEGAAMAGTCPPEQRSRAMAVFSVGGFVGQAVGPVYSGNMVDWLGLSGLAWGIPVALGLALLLVPLGRAVAAVPQHHSHQRTGLFTLLRGQMGPMFLVLAIGALRIIAASGVPVLVGFLLKAREASTSEIGWVQSAFMLGIGLGGLGCATLLRPSHERPILWICPLLVTPILLVIPWATGFLLAGLVCLSGLLLGVSLPVLVSLGQQLLPSSRRIASSITMGVSWGAGGAAVSLILAVCESFHSFEPAFLVFAVAAVLSALLCIWLPAQSPSGDVAPVGLIPGERPA